METLTGTLHRSKTRKRSMNWVKDWALMLAEEAGVVATRYYPERVFVSGDVPNTTGRGNMVWSQVSAKPFEGVPDGARVQFRANVKRWDNGNGHSLGGTCSRVRDVETLPPSAPIAGPRGVLP
jgi:hypothetical protein